VRGSAGARAPTRPPAHACVPWVEGCVHLVLSSLYFFSEECCCVQQSSLVPSRRAGSGKRSTGWSWGCASAVRQRWAFQRWRGARPVHPCRPWRATGKGFLLRGAGTVRRTPMAQPCKPPARVGVGMSGRRAALGLLLHGRTFQPCPHGPAREPGQCGATAQGALLRLPHPPGRLRAPGGCLIQALVWALGGWGAPRPCARGWVRQRQRRLAWRPLRRARPQALALC